MPFADFLQGIRDNATTTFNRLKNAGAQKRLVWACYLIGRADGDFSAEEKTGIAKLINRQMPEFGIDDIIDTIAAAEARVEFDETMGVGEIMSEIGKATGDEAESIVRAAVYIGAADGNFDDNEREIARTICNRLSLSPENYGI